LIDSIQVEAVVSDSRVDVFPFIMQMDRYRAAIAGSHHIDKTFHYHISLLKSPLPFRLGIDVQGTPEKYKIVPGRSLFTNEKLPAFSFRIDTIRINLRESIKRYFIQSADVMLGKDLRVFVIGKEIIAAVLRVNKNDFRANYKLGGDAILYTLSDKEKKMIQQIIDHFDFGLVGIDFLIGNNGELLFNEIEDVVGSRILSKVSDINLLEKYVTFIKNKISMKKI